MLNTTNQNLYQKVLNSLCRKNGLKEIKVIFDHSLLTRENIGGQYNFIHEIIVIDEREDPLLFKEILFHEFRHYWQSKKYKDIFIWWTMTAGPIYKQYYNTKFCSIEEDARVFGKSLGRKNRIDLLEFYDIRQLMKFKNNPLGLKYAIDIMEEF